MRGKRKPKVAMEENKKTLVNSVLFEMLLKIICEVVIAYYLLYGMLKP